MSEDRAGQEPETEDLDLLDEELGIEPDEEDSLDTGEDTNVEAEPSQAPASPPPPNREHRRIQALRETRKRAEEEARQLRAELDRLRTQQPMPQPQADPYRAAEEARREAEQVALMTPHEVAAYYANKSEQRMRRELADYQARFGDLLDKQSFEAVKARWPAARQMASEVESALITLRSQGQNFPREVIFRQIWADKALARAEKQEAQQRTAARRRVASQTTRPGSPRNGAAPQQRPRDDSDEALIQRLKNTTVGQAWE
jgi:hypothetical protein